MRIALLCTLLAAGPVCAQATQEPPAKSPAKDRPALKLRLDEMPGGRQRIGAGAAEKAPAKDLPALGDDARRIDPPAVSTGRSESGPYPKDTNPGR